MGRQAQGARLMFIPEFDHYSVGLSGGKDSTAALLVLLHVFKVDPSKIEVVFCDTGNEDPLTYAYIDLIGRQIHPVKVINPARDFYTLVDHKGFFPGARRRYCTKDLKVVPTVRYLRDVKKRHPGGLCKVSGVRQAEATVSNGRGGLPALAVNEETGLVEMLPIYGYSLADVVALTRQYIRPADVAELVMADPELAPEHKEEVAARIMANQDARNPLYSMGAGRVGCYPCIMARKKEIRAMAKYRPGRIEFIAEKELAVPSVWGMSTFFGSKTAPERFCNVELTHPDGRVIKVADIRSIVAWSRTSYGGRQIEMDLGQEIESCSIGGYCE